MQTIHNAQQTGEVDFHWFIVRTQPRQEEAFADVITKAQGYGKNILEVYCPVNTTVRVRRNGKDITTPLYTGHVFVYATLKALSDFIEQEYPQGGILYFKRKYADSDEIGQLEPLVVPVEQMQLFREFIDSYHDDMVILDRPYSDYAFNPKKGEYNEVVKIVEGPFKGRTGYVARFDGDKRLVFNLLEYEQDAIVPVTISIPNLWAFQLVRLTNIKDHKVGNATERDRAIDRMLGTIQACGYKDLSLSILENIVQLLCNQTTWSGLCKLLRQQKMETLSRAFAAYSKEDVSLIFSLIRYERSNKGYVHNTWRRNFLRPFLTPSSGLEGVEEKKDLSSPAQSRLEYYAALGRKSVKSVGNKENSAEPKKSMSSVKSVGDKIIPHESFTELIRPIEIREIIFDPDTRQEQTIKSPYFAHIGKMTDEDGTITYFVNWDKFLMEYFMTGDKANLKLLEGRTHQVKNRKNRIVGEKLIASFRNYAPTLYMILRSEDFPVKAADNLKVGDHHLNAFIVKVKAGEDEEASLTTLVDTCVRVCEEINSSAHLAIWRVYLRTVWLHL